MILLTGSGGYVGRHLNAALRQSGYQTVTLRNASHFAEIEGGWQLDLADERDLAKLPQMPARALIHLAGRIDIQLRPDPADAAAAPLAGEARLADLVRANVQTTAGLADFCRLRGIHLIYASSQTVYGLPGREVVDESTPTAPLEPYAASKVAAETIIMSACRSGLAATVLRFPGVFGGDRERGVVHAMCSSALNRKCIAVSAQFPLPFDILHVDDVIGGFQAAVERRPQRAQCFNLSTNEFCSLTLLAEDIASLVPGTEVEPAAIAQPRLLFSSDAAGERLGWSARPRRDRLQALLKTLQAA